MSTGLRDHTGRNAEATAVLVIVSRLRDPSHRPRFLQLSPDFERWLAGQPAFLAYEVVDGGAAIADRIHWRTMRDAVRPGQLRVRRHRIAAGFAEIVAEYHATSAIT